MKKILIHLRTSVKLISLATLATMLVIGLVAFIYKPIYSVSLNGEEIGYTGDKSSLQTKINNYIEEGEEDHVAFVQVDHLPEYKLCLLKKGISTNDDEIFDKIKSTGTAYYKYYAILDDGEEKMYVETFEEAEQALNGLKSKDSNNKDNITIVEKYEKEDKELVTSEIVISELYEKKDNTVKVAKSSTPVKAATGVNTGKKINIGINIIRPVSGVVTSRFGSRWGRAHKGIDIGAPKGTSIKAVADGTVTVSSNGYNGGYGNYIIISHGNGVETVYGHCSALYAKVGQKVSQGQSIAAVGNTGRSYGNHLHLEIRVNGVAQNPQNYVY